MCEQQKVMQYHYRELNACEQKRVRQHLGHCGDCREFLQMLTGLSRSYRQLPRVKVCANLSRKIKKNAGEELKRVPPKISYLHTAAIFVAIVLLPLLLLGKHRDKRSIRLSNAMKYKNAMPGIEWQTDIAGKLGCLQTKVSILTGNWQKEVSRRNGLSASLKSLDMRMHRFEMSIQSSKKSHVEHSLDVVKKRIYRLDSQIGFFE